MLTSPPTVSNNGSADPATANVPTFVPAPTPAAAPPPAPPLFAPSVDAPSTSELERLRDILFGSQSRSTEKRLADLELRLEAVRRELSEALTEKNATVAQAAASDLSLARNELSARLEQQVTDHGQQLRNAQQSLANRLEQQDLAHTTQFKTLQKDFTDRLDKLGADQTAQLRALQKELSDRLEQLATDCFTQLRATHKELSERLDRQAADNAERLRQLQVEARQRDEGLRQELLTFTASLDDRKTSRYELGQMLVEVGQRLRSEKP